MAERAARLAKADLVTGMVGEFPELQGVMGGYYARAQGEPEAVADAIRDHYKPVGQGDDVPTAPVTVAVSLADKLDTLGGFFGQDLKPTGSKDPFALRRAAIQIASTVISNGIRLPLIIAFDHAVKGAMEDRTTGAWMYPSKSFGASNEQYCESAFELLDFFADRLKVQQREAGVRHDLIDAVFALGGEDDLVRLLARVKALQAFVGTDDGANLLTGYRRAANILKKEGYESNTPLPVGESFGSALPPAGPGQRGTLSTRNWARSAEPSGRVRAGEPSPDPDSPHPSAPSALPPSPTGRGNAISLSYTPEPAEDALIRALDGAEPQAAAAVEREDFEGAMAALASLRGPIDAFFDKVTVNDADAEKRAARLALLARMRDAVHKVADFSKIEG